MTQRFLWYKIDIMIGKFEFVLKWVFSEKYASETWKKMNVIKLFMEKIYPYFLLIWNSNNGPFYGGAVIAQWFRLHLPFPPPVRVPSISSMLLSFMVKLVMYLSLRCEKNKKEAGYGPFKQKEWAIFKSINLVSIVLHQESIVFVFLLRFRLRNNLFQFLKFVEI